MSFFSGKSWYKSKTMWVNIISIAIIIVQYYSDRYIIPLEAQAPILAILNIMLRTITSSSIKRIGDV